jgi:endonuclease/exonuclease/phosphatase (EEP) superfamily protein YafD
MQILADAVLLLATAAAAGALASVGGRVSRTLDVAAHFAPLWLIGALAAVAGGVVVGGGAGRASGVLGAIGAVASGAVIAPDLVARLTRRVDAAADHAEAAGTLKVVQLNLWRRNVDVPATVAWLVREAADVLVIEEVIDNAAGIPEALAQAYPYRQADVRTGTRVLSRHPLLACGIHHARSTKTHSTGAWATVDHPAGAFTVLGFQATWPVPPGAQQADTDDLAALLERFDRDSLIVCGDFNSTPWSAALRRQDRLFGLERRSRALLTWPVQPYTRFRLASPLPFLALDHVYAGAAWETVSVRVGPRLGSDHLPVVAVLARRGAREPGSRGQDASRPNESGPIVVASRRTLAWPSLGSRPERGEVVLN